MEQTNTDESDVLETTENVAEETTETPSESEVTAEELAELRRKAALADELEPKNKQLFERLKKAESAKTKVPSNEDGLSTKDVLYLAKADIHAEDVDEVLDYAKKMKVTVAEAHKFYKPILTERTEERRTANASHTKGGARGTSKVSGDELLRKAEQTGEVPESAEGLQNLFAARMERRIK